MELLPLRTARLLLRPVDDADLLRLFSILGDGEVMKLALYERALTSDEAQEFIDADFTRSADDVMHLGVLCGSEDRAIVGFAGLLPCRYFPGDLEIGFVLGREHQGRGYATEIGRNYSRSDSRHFIARVSSACATRRTRPPVTSSGNSACPKSMRSRRRTADAGWSTRSRIPDAKRHREHRIQETQDKQSTPALRADGPAS